MSKPKIDWLNHFLEFTVVIVGILLAFQLEKCAEHREQKELVNSHLSYIRQECQENKDRLEEGIVHVENQLQVCDSLFQVFYTKKDFVSIRNFSVQLLDMRNVMVQADAYNVLVQSGDIRFVKQYDEKRAIISLYEGLKKIDGVNANLQKLYDNHFYPYLKKHFDLVNWSNMDPKSKVNVDRYFSFEYANTISTYRFLLNSKLATYKSVQNQLELFLD